MLDGYVSEKEQIEQIKKWWQENGKFILMAVLIGLVVGFGWRYWHQLQLRRSENAAMIYQSVLDANAKNDFITVQGGAKILMDKFSNTPYASLAALLLAKENVQNNQLDKALTDLRYVITDDSDNRLQQIAQLNIARILLSQHHVKAAWKTVAHVTDKQFAPLAAWVKGDIYRQEGNTKNATAQYQIAKNAFDANPAADTLFTTLMAQ